MRRELFRIPDDWVLSKYRSKKNNILHVSVAYFYRVRVNGHHISFIRAEGVGRDGATP